MEEKNYLSAKEAHEISASMSHIDEVMGKIKSACERGFYKFLFKEMADADRAILQKLGYKVVPIGGYYNVSW